MNVFTRVRPAAWGMLYVSLICLGLGLGLHRYRTERALLIRTRARLAGVAQRIDEAEQGQALLAQRFHRPAAGLAEVLEAYPPRGNWEVVAETVTELPMAYRHREERIQFSEWGWEDVRRLVSRAAEQSPPWRLTALEISAGLEGLEGVLTLEALDKNAERP